MAIGVMSLLMTDLEAAAQRPVSVEAFGIDGDGSERSKVVNIRVLQRIRETSMPLLPYVFFAAGSDKISVRYHQEDSTTFSEAAITIAKSDSTKPIELYPNVLNVIGQRMRTFPSTRVRICGYRSEDETDASLPMKRAKAVAGFLRRQYGISEQRMDLCVARDGMIPSERSSTASDLTAEEHRRVELIGDWEIVGPSIVRDTSVSVTPPQILFRLANGVTDSRHGELRVVAKSKAQGERQVNRKQIPSPPKDTAVVWDAQRSPERGTLLTSKALVAAYSITKSDNATIKGQTDIPILSETTSRIGDSIVQGERVHEYRLILFRYGSDSLEAHHRRTLDSISNADPTFLTRRYTRVDVFGFTDNIGSDATNQRLAAARAQTVGSYLQALLSRMGLETIPVVTHGVGPSDLNADGFASPESRMYCRTVHVIIRTKAEVEGD